MNMIEVVTAAVILITIINFVIIIALLVPRILRWILFRFAGVYV